MSLSQASGFFFSCLGGKADRMGAYLQVPHADYSRRIQDVGVFCEAERHQKDVFFLVSIVIY